VSLGYTLVSQLSSKPVERTVATYQSLLEAGRLHKFSPQGFKAVVVDEAHHAAAPSYVWIFLFLGMILILGSDTAIFCPFFTQELHLQNATHMLALFGTLFPSSDSLRLSVGMMGLHSVRYLKGLYIIETFWT